MGSSTRPASSPATNGAPPGGGPALPPGAIARLGTGAFAHPSFVVALAASDDPRGARGLRGGQTLATAASGSPIIRFWDAATGRLKASTNLAGIRQPIGLAFDRKGRLLILADSGDLCLFDLITSTLVWQVAAPRGARGCRRGPATAGA